MSNLFYCLGLDVDRAILVSLLVLCSLVALAFVVEMRR